MRIRIMTQDTLCVAALAQFGARHYRRDVPDDLSSRIHATRRKLGMNQAEFGNALGVNQATVSRWEKGSHPDGMTLARIAKLAGMNVEAFTFADFEAGRGGPQLFVKGEVAAGVWREAWEFDRSDWIPYQGGSHIEAPATSRFGLRVVGESMNEVYPPGTILDCVSCLHAGIEEVQSGQRVIVVRRKVTGEVEATVKEYLVTTDGAWLVPKSTNPAYQQPIPASDGSPDIEETQIVAVVKGSYRPE